MAKTKRAEKAKEKSQQRGQALAMLSMPDDGWDEYDQGHENYIKKDKRGRPTVMTKQTLQKLRDAFRIGCPDWEACIFAGISEATLYGYCQEHPEFLEEKEELKQAPVLVARAVIVNAIQRHSIADSWEYLKRKRKQEFSDAKLDQTSDALSIDDLEKLDRGDIQIVEKNKK